jgi:hypothetical protein
MVPTQRAAQRALTGVTLKRFLNQEQRSIFLLLSVLSIYVLTAFLENNRAGEALLVISMYLTLLAATMELAGRKVLFRSAIPIAIASAILLFLSHTYLRGMASLQVASDLVLAGFLGLVTISLFNYLGQPGAITSGRLYVSVSIYFLMGLIWFVLFNVINAFHPGCFAENGTVLAGHIAPSKILYFSLASLTTLGYGDIVAVYPLARIVAALEAAAGVLYIAITVARLWPYIRHPGIRHPGRPIRAPNELAFLGLAALIARFPADTFFVSCVRADTEKGRPVFGRSRRETFPSPLFRYQHGGRAGSCPFPYW